MRAVSRLIMGGTSRGGEPRGFMMGYSCILSLLPEATRLECTSARDKRTSPITLFLDSPFQSQTVTTSSACRNYMRIVNPITRRTLSPAATILHNKQ